MTPPNYTVYIADCVGEDVHSQHGENLSEALTERDLMRAELDPRRNLVRVCDGDDPERGEFDWEFEG